MARSRKATRNSAGHELTADQVLEKYDEIRHSSRRIPKQLAAKLIRKYYSQGEVQVESTKKVSLVCPISKRRIADGCRGEQCLHLECFDLRSYLQYHTQLTYWECPVLGCRNNVTLELLRIDEYFMSVLRAVPDECLEVEILEDGSFNAIVANSSTDVIEIAEEGLIVAEECEPGPVKVEPMDVAHSDCDVVLDQPVDTGHKNYDILVGLGDEECLPSESHPNSSRHERLVSKKLPGSVGGSRKRKNRWSKNNPATRARIQNIAEATRKRREFHSARWMHIRDVDAPQPTPYGVDRDVLTLPAEYVELRQVTTPRAFARVDLYTHMRFGPYEGFRHLDVTDAEQGGRSFSVRWCPSRANGRPGGHPLFAQTHQLDGQYRRWNNWMSCIERATSEETANMRDEYQCGERW